MTGGVERWGRVDRAGNQERRAPNQTNISRTKTSRIRLAPAARRTSRNSGSATAAEGESPTPEPVTPDSARPGMVSNETPTVRTSAVLVQRTKCSSVPPGGGRRVALGARPEDTSSVALMLCSSALGAAPGGRSIREAPSASTSLGTGSPHRRLCWGAVLLVGADGNTDHERDPHAIHCSRRANRDHERS
mgnify:CR=1 FL=1